MRNSVRTDYYRSKLTSPFDSPTSNYVTYQISNHLVHKQGHYGNIFNFWHIWKKVWGRVITPLWCLKAPSPATKKWIFEFYTKFGFRNHFQTFWPQWLVKSELSFGLLRLILIFYKILPDEHRRYPNICCRIKAPKELQEAKAINQIV